MNSYFEYFCSNNVLSLYKRNISLSTSRYKFLAQRRFLLISSLQVLKILEAACKTLAKTKTLSQVLKKQ